ncbi:MAG TPA: isocitrate/isopropylmalate family dehydrogenase, partial [Pseudomonadales bacterium]
MAKKILILPGDGIGPEIVSEAVKVLETVKQQNGLNLQLEEALIGGAAIDASGT